MYGRGGGLHKLSRLGYTLKVPNDIHFLTRYTKKSGSVLNPLFVWSACMDANYGVVG